MYKTHFKCYTSLQKRHAYLQQFSTHSTSYLGNELHAILEPMYYETILAPNIELPQEIPSLMKEGTVPIPKKAW